MCAQELLLGKKCTLWLVLHDLEFKANIHLPSKNSLKTNMFYTLLLSLKILLNLCILSCKQETTCQILKSRKIQVTQVECSVFSFTSVSLTLKINQFQTVSNFGFH